jgi:colanic acid/amylovoran biosynthesis glycosyltransferase
MEGIPNSMLEAMCTGLPIIATLHGGIPEAVKQNVTGILVPERAVNDLHGAMYNLTQMEGVWRKLSVAAAEDMRQNFELEKNISALEACYAEAVQLHQQAKSATPEG